MPGALGDLFDTIQTALSQLPPPVIVIGLLFGPTAAWIGYRVYAAPRPSKDEGHLDDLYWICPDCRSANEVRHHHCYHCSTDRDAIAGTLRVVDHDQIVEIAEEPGSPGVPVGPGRAPEAVPIPVMAAPAVDPLVARPLASLASRPRPVVPIDDELDVIAASQAVAATSGSGGSTGRDAAD